jgi:3-oxoadipate enol-lactonase
MELHDRGTTFVRDVGPTDGAGTGPPTFLLHGWLATADLNWFPAYDTLSRSRRLLAIDHRGHGRGIKSRRRFRLADCADDVASVIRQLDCGPVTAVGYSMGGPIAQLLWYRHPELVSGLVLCATSRNFRGRPGERAAFALMGGATNLARATPPTVRRAVRERVAGGRFTADTPQGVWARQEFERGDGRMLLEAGHALGRFSSHEWIHEVDVPAAVVLTEQDQLVPPRRQRRLADSIPGAEIHPVAGNHVVCAESPEIFVPVLDQAIRSVERRNPQTTS